MTLRGRNSRGREAGECRGPGCNHPTLFIGFPRHLAFIRCRPSSSLDMRLDALVVDEDVVADDLDDDGAVLALPMSSFTRNGTRVAGSRLETVSASTRKSLSPTGWLGGVSSASYRAILRSTLATRPAWKVTMVKVCGSREFGR